MKLSASDLKTVEGVRKIERLRAINTWVLGLSALIFFSFAIFYLVLLAKHLHTYDLPLSAWFQVLSDSQHPSGVSVASVFVASALLPFMLFAAMHGAACAFIVSRRSRQHELLLRLVDEQSHHEEV